MGHVQRAMEKYDCEKDQLAAEAPTTHNGDAALETQGDEVAGDAVAPHTNGYSPVLVAYYNRVSRVTEQYRAMRVNLMAHYDDKPFSLMLTSAEAGEGKTVTCMNLAFTLVGREHCRTIVIDADMRKGAVARLLRQKRGPGLAELLMGLAKPEDVIRPTTCPTVSIIHAGLCKPSEAGELLARPELEKIFAKLWRQFDVVLVDAPPVNVVSDACLIGQVVRDALLVVRMNKTRRESIRRAIRQLGDVDVNVTGMVLTHQKYYIPKYLYRRS